MNIDLTNKITVIFSFILINIQSTISNSFMLTSLTHASDTLNTCVFNIISCLSIFALTSYNLQQLILDSLLSFMKANYVEYSG